MRLNPKQIVDYTGGRFLIEPIDASEILTSITWDSRNVKPGAVYVALPGERVDGHSYVEAAFRSGARAALVTDSPDKSACVLAAELGCAVIEVPNTFHAIEDLARQWRGHINGKVVAITGSVGKTSTKNLVRDVCASQFETVATEGNQNNELGVPNTILAADPSTEVVVVEMGMRGLGQIKELCEIARPDWGIVTNIGECHMELLGSKENIAKAKGELFEALPSGTGWAFVNDNDEYSKKLILDTDLDGRFVHVAMFGGESAPDCSDDPTAAPVRAHVWAEDVENDAEGRPSFKLCARGFYHPENKQATLFDLEPDMISADCELSVRGRHNVTNACAAAGVGLALGIDIEKIADALSASLTETGRLETVKARDGYRVINDAYNANPDSMRAALAMLASMDVEGKRIAVLGDMGELGDVEVACHRGVGEAAAANSIDWLICIGDLANHIADAAIESGLPEDRIVRASSIGEVLEALEGNIEPDDVVLVKASHFMRLDRVVDGLVS